MAEGFFRQARQIFAGIIGFIPRKFNAACRENTRPDGPIAVAEIVNELELDQDSIIAALLHDCIEDTDSTHDDIARLFSPQDMLEPPVYPALHALLRQPLLDELTRMQYTSREDEQMENLRKMFMAMAKDVRVILIKLCDRLHNMRTLQYQSDKKQKEKALETMEVYAPIAWGG